jgi:LysR family transcriptional regulator, regulator for metE and metH
MMNNAHYRIERRHLELVRAVAESGSVTRAAGKLFLSQSAVSHQLVDLERELGARLFDRIGKRMVPTALGARMLGGAGQVLGALAELERSLVATGPARVPLRVTSSCFTSYAWLPAALAHFGKSHPDVDLEIVLEATRRATAALAADEVDFAIVTEPPRDDTWERCEVVESELVAIASPRHPVCKRFARGALRWGALHDCTILVPDIGEQNLARLDEAVRTSRQRDTGQPAAPVTVRKIPLSDALLELVRSGAGVGILDRWTVSQHTGARKPIRALPLSPHAARRFHAVWRRANPRGLPMHELVELVRAHATKAIASRRAPSA